MGVTVPPDRRNPSHQAFDQPTADGPISQIIQAAVDTGIAVGALEQAKVFARQARPWIDSQQEHGWQDPFTIAAIGDLEWRVHGTEAILAKAGQRRRPRPRRTQRRQRRPRLAGRRPGQSAVRPKPPCSPAASSSSWPAPARSPASTTSTASGATPAPHTLHDPARWKYHLIGNFVLNGVKPARHAWN